eukprot:468019_1
MNIGMAILVGISMGFCISYVYYYAYHLYFYYRRKRSKQITSQITCKDCYTTTNTARNGRQYTSTHYDIGYSYNNDCTTEYTKRFINKFVNNCSAPVYIPNDVLLLIQQY